MRAWPWNAGDAAAAVGPPESPPAAPPWRLWLRRWVFKGVATGEAGITLRYRRLYIVPTRNGLLFAVMLFAMWLGAINYNNSMIYLLTFLLASVALVGILHTFRNLIGLRVTPLPAAPVFAGEAAAFPLLIENPAGRDRVGVGLQYRGVLQNQIDLPAQGGGRLSLRLPARRRGRLAAERCALITIFPTGLFRAWTWLDPQLSCLVYPSPETGAVPPPPAGRGEEPGQGRGGGNEDFQGLRNYRPGDSPQHIAWRRAGRGEDLHTKQFGGEAPGRIWLDWNGLGGMAPEARLSRLCRWVLEAELGEQRYGLRLPGVELAPDRGERHRRRCLEALASYRP